jgi:GH24 family phage-related lysozyme (muramidase)
MPSFNLLAYLKDYEKLSLNEYMDATGNLTIGYGHRVLKNEDFSKGISKELAETIFANDVSLHADVIYSNVKVPLNQNQFDALVSFVFNVGIGAFKKSTLLKLLNNGDYSNAGNEFMRWVYGSKRINGVTTKVVVQGLYNRRYSDMRIYLNGIYQRFNG